jgi:hypothetical protein
VFTNIITLVFALSYILWTLFETEQSSFYKCIFQYSLEIEKSLIIRIEHNYFLENITISKQDTTKI